MASLNQCQFIGNLGQAPEIRYLADGTPVANFSIAVAEKWKNKDGEKQESTEWVRCVAWNRLAEICGEWLGKGSSVWVSGKMQTRKWDDKEGTTRYTAQIQIREMQMLGSKGESQGNQQPDPPGDLPESDVPF